GLGIINLSAFVSSPLPAEAPDIMFGLYEARDPPHDGPELATAAARISALRALEGERSPAARTGPDPLEPVGHALDPAGCRTGGLASIHVRNHNSSMSKLKSGYCQSIPRLCSSTSARTPRSSRTPRSTARRESSVSSRSFASEPRNQCSSGTPKPILR